MIDRLKQIQAFKTMKRIVLFLAVLLVGFNCSSKNGANISFKTKVHDFGQIPESNRTATCSFTFTNKGTGPLVIHKAIASCGCTTPIYPKEPIAPGASGEIKVTYNTVGRPNAFHKTITIYSNDIDTPNVVLIIKGNVIPKTADIEDSYPKNMDGLRLKRTQVSMLEAPIGSTRVETIEVLNTNKTTTKIAFSKLPKHIQVTASDPELKPNATGILTIRYTPSLAKDYGKREDSFFIVTNPKDKANPNNRINVSAYITEDFSRLTEEQVLNAPSAVFSENRINLGQMPYGSHKIAQITISNKGKSTLNIRKIVPEYDGIKVIPEKKDIAAGKTIKVKIDFNSGTFVGNVVQRISFITNDPRNSTNRIFLTALVSENNRQ
jgi:hypothetical protein